MLKPRDEPAAMPHMQRALLLAYMKGAETRPNPKVGAVLVREDQIVGVGWHERAGMPHAEVNALQKAGEKARGATLYVTLEPCSHHGRTPPCTDALIEAGIARVVVGLKDPNPLVDGLAKLREAGIEVEMADAATQERCALLNEEFLTWMATGRAMVTLKYAMTLDGKIATRTGHSQWISCQDSRQFVHELRARSAAIMVGSGTVLKDDPQLTARLPDAPQPARVVLDARGRCAPDARVFADGARRILVTHKPRPEMTERGVEVWMQEGHDLRATLTRLGQEGLTSVVLEGGGTLNASAIAGGLVDKVACFIAPRFVGGAGALTGVEGEGVEEVTQGWVLSDMTCRPVGTDLLVEGYLQRHWSPS